MDARLDTRFPSPEKIKDEYFEKHRWIFALAAVACFPLFYWVWSGLFPQPYENLPLRLLGSAIFAPVVIDHYWPIFPGNRKVMRGYFHGAIFFGLPFFFAYMLFQNGCNAVWIGSCVVAFTLMIQLLRLRLFAIHLVAGTALAWGAYYLTAAPSHAGLAAAGGLEIIPILLFGFVMGLLSSHTVYAVHIERGKAILETVINIALKLEAPIRNMRRYIGGLGEREQECLEGELNHATALVEVLKTYK